MLRMPKSVWESVSLHSESSKDAVKSWFAGMTDDMEGPLKANVLTRTSDDRTLKIRALFKLSNGGTKELIHTRGSSGRFTITMREPTKQRWA